VTPNVEESVVAPVNVETPETVKLSSIVIVPPAESSVKLPVDVSISLSFAIPMRILSISAPPLASTSPVNVETPVTANVDERAVGPVNVETPETVKLSSIATVPPVESSVRLPVDVSISLSLARPIRMLSISAPPLASTSPVNVETPMTPNVEESVVAPVNVETPETVKLSSIATVPPVESSVKLPVEVSISLLFEIPIRTLPISAPPFASTSPVNVETPETLNWLAKRVEVLVVIPAKVETPETLNWLAKRVEVLVVIPAKVETPETLS